MSRLDQFAARHKRMNQDDNVSASKSSWTLRELISQDPPRQTSKVVCHGCIHSNNNSNKPSLQQRYYNMRRSKHKKMRHNSSQLCICDSELPFLACLLPATPTIRNLCANNDLLNAMCVIDANNGIPIMIDDSDIESEFGDNDDDDNCELMWNGGRETPLSYRGLCLGDDESEFPDTTKSTPILSRHTKRSSIHHEDSERISFNFDFNHTDSAMSGVDSENETPLLSPLGPLEMDNNGEDDDDLSTTPLPSCGSAPLPPMNGTRFSFGDIPDSSNAHSPSESMALPPTDGTTLLSKGSHISTTETTASAVTPVECDEYLSSPHSLNLDDEDDDCDIISDTDGFPFGDSPKKCPKRFSFEGNIPRVPDWIYLHVLDIISPRSASP